MDPWNSDSDHNSFVLVTKPSTTDASIHVIVTFAILVYLIRLFAGSPTIAQVVVPFFAPLPQNATSRTP